MVTGHSPIGRRRTLLGRLAAAILVAGTATLPVNAFETPEVPSRFLQDGANTARPTKAWLEFCDRLPEACDVGILEPRTIAHSLDLWVDLVRVNKAVNREIRPVTDVDQWGVSDRWDFPETGSGDCEDIQIEKRRRLIELGYPARAMRMAVVINPEGEGHAVLLVRTERGDYVLDNRTDAVLPWFAARYTWVKRESDDGSARWVALGGVRSPVETAGDVR